MRDRPPWKSEAELCDQLMDDARRLGWVPYPETEGWDILLVAGSVQIGVQAKMHANVKVLSQAIGWARFSLVNDRTFEPGEVGPAVHAVAVPFVSDGFREVARLCRIAVFAAKNRHGYRGEGWTFALPPPEEVGTKTSAIPVWAHERPHDLPEVLPNVRAGVPSPIQVTKWKVGAVRLALLLRSQGYLTSKDFGRAGVSPSFWVGRYLAADGKVGRLNRLVPIPGVALPDEKFPDIARQLRDGPDRPVVRPRDEENRAPRALFDRW